MAPSNNLSSDNLLKPKISIFGVGGAGGNALNNMIRSNLEGVEFIAANTDAQALANSLAANRIQLGVDTTKGLGAGSFPDRGKAAAEENIDEISGYLDGNNMIFITAGMGGGTGTGAAPVIAKLAREREILTVGVVTKPFDFEGKYRMSSALEGIEELKKYVDTLIVIPNQNLFRIANEQTTFESAFKMADNVLHAGVRGVTDLITMPGLVNLDFSDIRTIMTKMGKALMGTGEAEGDNRAVIACEEAISNPLLDDVCIKGAKGVLVNMTGGPDMTLFEADLAVNTIKKQVNDNANIIFGSAFNENMEGKIRISVVATGIEDENGFYVGENQNISENDAQEEPAIDIFENAHKARSQMVHEISVPQKSADEMEADRKNIEKKVINSAMGDSRTFFDPGMNNLPDEELPTAQMEDFSDHEVAKGAAKKDAEQFEESANEDLNDDLDLEEKNENSTEDYRGSAFEERDIFDRFSDSFHKIEEKITSSAPEEGKKEPENLKSKKGGFGLFGFMNTKNKSEESKALKKKQKLAKEPVKERLENSGPIVEDDEDIFSFDGNGSRDHLNDDHKEFGANKDDILNVPAFFRRKK